MFDNLFDFKATSDRRPQTKLLYETNLFIRNLGTPFILCLLIILVVLLLYIIDAIAKAAKRQRIRRWVDRAKKKIFFNFLIKFTLESYLLFAVCSALMIMRFNWKESVYWTSSLATIVFMIYICVLPVLTGVFLYRNSDRLEEPEVLEKYSNLYSDLDLKKGRKVLVIPVIYQLRRILFVFSLSNGENMPVFQVLNVMYQIFLIMVLYVVFKPFEGQLRTKLDVFNEFAILICTYCILLYTDIISDQQTKLGIGWAMIVATAFNILVNVILMLKQSLALLIIKCRECWAKKKKGVPISAT